MKQAKLTLSLLLCICMCIALLPMMALTSSAAESWLWPVKDCYIVSSNFGYRSWTDQYGFHEGNHGGIDIIGANATHGMAIRATKSGTIYDGCNTIADYTFISGSCGNYTCIDHGDGTCSIYMHMQPGNKISGTVSQGETIGYIGKTGESYGSHLHFEIYTERYNRQGSRLNPQPTNPEITINNPYILPSGWPSQKTTYVFEAGPGKPALLNMQSLYAADSPISFSWAPISGVSGYELIITDLSGNTVHGEYGIPNTTTSFSYQLPSGSYKAAVVSVWPSGGYDYSEWVEFTVVKNLYAPIVSITNPGTSTYPSVFSWTSISGVSGYELVITDMDGNIVHGEYDIPSTTTSFSYQLSCGTYRVAAVSVWPSGGYDYSEWVEFTVVKNPYAPIVNIVSQGTSIHPSVFSWTPITGVSGYELIITDLSGNTVHGKYDISSTTTSYSYQLPCGIYRVAAVSVWPSGGYDYSEWVEFSVEGEHNYISTITEPTCEEQGYITYICSICGDSYKDSYTNALGHSWDAGTVTLEPTETEPGVMTFTCTRCGKIRTESIPVLPHAHNYTATVIAPTCTEQGYTTYTCSDCGDSYVDSYVEALGHDYELTGWQWTGYTTAKATFTCKNDSSHVQTVTATITNNRTEPTCEAPGKVVYTAKVSYEGKDYTDTKEQTLDALGHKWNTPTYTWASDNSTVTATRTCKNDASHIETETVNTTSSVATPATCTAKGKTTYTATFTNSAFSTQTKTVENVPALGHTPAAAVKEKEIAATCTEAGGYDMVTTCAVCGTELKREHTDVPALGHDWGEWCPIPMNFCTDPRIEDRTCNRCGATESRTLPPDGHTPGEPVKENAIAPTCGAAGGYDMVIYCTACGAEISREHTDVSALGHDWNEPDYVWTDDYGIVTATRTCKNDASHKETETVNTTAEVTKEATYDEEGEITFTATFENEAFATQTKTVATPKLEKPDNPTPGLPCDGGDDCPGNKFTDMPAKGNWAHDPIDWAIVTGVTSGTSETTFSPNAGCTRAQVVTFLWRAAGEPEPTTANNPFKDVAEGTWYYKAVLWASETGVTAGTSATAFSPNQTCTRGQIVTFLWRFEGSPAPKTANNPFADVKVGAYYEKAVLWASETGVTAGTSATTFSPDVICTRAQVVTFLYRDLAG